jgi:integrase
MAMHDYIGKNPAENLVLKLNTKASEEREIYSANDLASMIAGLSELNQNAHPERFFVPIIALFSGMRLNEICQLYVDDILEKDGIHYFDVNDKGINKRVKTRNATRIIPIHPVLIKLGFLNFVEKTKSGPLWKKLKYDEKNGYGNLFQKWFQRFNRVCITTDRKKVFHSFRHNFANNLKQKLVDARIINQLMGHQNEDISADRYGKDFNLAVLRDAIMKIDYGINMIEIVSKDRNDNCTLSDRAGGGKNGIRTK